MITGDQVFYLAALVGILAGIVQLGRWLSPKIKSLLRRLDDHLNEATKLNEIEKALTELIKEVQDNNCRDELQKISHVLAITNSRQEALMDDYELPVFETNAEGNTLYVNKAMCNFMGRFPREFYGSGWVNIVAEGDRERYVEHWYRAVKENRNFEESFTMVRPNGTTEKVMCKAKALKNDKDEILGYLGTVVPVGFINNETNNL